MDDVNKKIILSLASGAAEKGFILAGGMLAAHGWISGSQTETFVSIGMAGLPIVYSFVQDYVAPILKAQLEVLKAKSLAQAAKLSQAGLPPVTVTQIADQSPTLTPAAVDKAIKTLPAAVQANIAS